LYRLRRSAVAPLLLDPSLIPGIQSAH
jgi:hypothetical protein